MGGNGSHRQAKNKATPASFSLLGFIKHRRRQHQRDDRGWDQAPSPRKAWCSDYDRGHYVAKPGIDELASAFIVRFHESRVSESERHAIINA